MSGVLYLTLEIQNISCSYIDKETLEEFRKMKNEVAGASAPKRISGS